MKIISNYSKYILFSNICLKFYGDLWRSWKDIQEVIKYEIKSVDLHQMRLESIDQRIYNI